MKIRSVLITVLFMLILMPVKICKAADFSSVDWDNWVNAGRASYSYYTRLGISPELKCPDGYSNKSNRYYYCYDAGFAIGFSNNKGDTLKSYAVDWEKTDGAYEEEAANVINGDDKYYRSKGVKETARYIEKTYKGSKYRYYIGVGSINKYNGCDRNVCHTTTQESKEDQIIQYVHEDLGNEANISDVFHIGYLNDWVLADSKNQKVDEQELKISEIIKNWGYWQQNPGILPINKVTVQNNVVHFSTEEQDKYMASFDHMGINIKHYKQSPNVISTKFYFVYVAKVPIANTSCSVEEIETEDGKDYDFMDKSGNKIELATKKEVLEKFVSDCGCDAANTYWWYKSKWGDTTGETEYYKKFCKQEEKEQRTFCKPNVEDKDCTSSNFTNSNSNTKTFTIGDDISNDSCVFKEYKNETIDDTENKGVNTTTFTQNYNEYCSLTCAEQIDVTLPSQVSSVLAGRYWTWDTTNNLNLIKLKGTRVCNARIALEQYKSDLGITTYNNYSRNVADVKERLVGTSGILKIDNLTKYPLAVELQDLKDAYDEYIRAGNLDNSEVSSDDTNWVSQTCSDGSSGCGYYSCKKYTFNSDYTGETHVKYTNNGYHSCSKSGKWSNNYDDYIKDEGILKKKTEAVTKKINAKTKNVNVCTHTDNELEGNKKIGLNSYKNIDYDFNPILRLSYDDKSYGTKYTNFKANIVEDTKASSNNYSEATVPYNFNSINGSVTGTYISANQNQLRWEKTATYNSSRYYYLNYPSFSTGILQYKETEDDYNNNVNNAYKLGNNKYPVSLKASEGTNKFYFEITNIGVDQKTGKTNNRFGRLVTPRTTNNSKAHNSLQYTCYYNVENDVTTPDKTNFFYRNISLNNFDPNNRAGKDKLGKNWNTEDTVYGEKASKTLEQINKGEEIYSEPEYSFTLTPDNMIKIKTYNKEQEKDNNGYANWNMRAVSKDGNNASPNTVWFKSEFLEDAKKNGWVSKSEYETKFESWENYSSLQGPGPAWK